ncbi:MAG: ArsR family transcriptional regulator, partial [Microbacterium sp.]
SQLAEVIWRDSSPVPAASAGTRPGAAVNPGAAASASRHGLRIDTTRRPRHIDEVRADGDLVITVCDDAHERLDSRDDLHWSIPDPAAKGTAEAFDSAFDTIRHRISAFSSRLSVA